MCYGMHPNAEIGFRFMQAEQMFNSIVELMPRSGGGEGGMSLQEKAKQALEWLILVKEELGPEWLDSALFRFGASSLLGDIERQLEHQATGRYSASYRHPMG